MTIAAVARIALAAAVCGILVALISQALKLSPTLQIVALLIGVLVASLVDPLRFWATDQCPPRTRLGRLLLRTPRQPR